MASRGWYAEKMAKLKKEKIAEQQERDAISAIDQGNYKGQKDYSRSRNPYCRRKADYNHGFHSLGTRSMFADERVEYERKYSIQRNAGNRLCDNVDKLLAKYR